MDSIINHPSALFNESTRWAVAAEAAEARTRFGREERAGEAHKRFGSEGFETVDDPYEAAAGADALVLITEWKQYWAPDFDRLAHEMKQAVLVDARNIWSPTVVRRRGIAYYAIGRP